MKTPLLALLLFFQELTPRQDGWTQLATGGVLALLVLREVFSFLKPKQAPTDVDIASVVRGAVRQSVVDVLLPVMDKQGEILRAIEHTQARQTEILVKIGSIQEADRR